MQGHLNTRKPVHLTLSASKLKIFLKFKTPMTLKFGKRRDFLVCCEVIFKIKAPDSCRRAHLESEHVGDRGRKVSSRHPELHEFQGSLGYFRLYFK